MGEARAQGGGCGGNYQTHPRPGLGSAGGHRIGPSGQMQPRETRPLPAGPGSLAGMRKESWAPPLRSSPHNFLERGPPGHATGLSTSLRNLWERRECEVAPTPPQRKLSYRLSVCHAFLLAWHKAEAEKRVTDGREGGTHTCFFLVTGLYSVIF